MEEWESRGGAGRGLKDLRKGAWGKVLATEMGEVGGTVNVEISALYIFLRYSHFRNIRENMCIVKITFIMPYIDNNLKSANI